VERGDEPLPAGPVERLQAGEGRDARLVQRVVAVAPADSGDRPLIAQDRVDPAAVVALEQEALTLGGVDVGAELGQGPVVAFGQDPPARLALGAELLDQDRRRVLEAEAHDGALRLGRLRRVLYIDPPALREVHEQARPAKLKNEELAPPPHALHRLAGQGFRAGHDGLQPGERQRDSSGEGVPGDVRRQPLGEGRNLR
jgi:hypothetical protein